MGGKGWKCVEPAADEAVGHVSEYWCLLEPLTPRVVGAWDAGMQPREAHTGTAATVLGPCHVTQQLSPCRPGLQVHAADAAFQPAANCTTDLHLLVLRCRITWSASRSLSSQPAGWTCSQHAHHSRCLWDRKGGSCC